MLKILLILLIIYFIFNKNNSKFWKTQFVNRFYGPLKIIEKMPYRNIKIPKSINKIKIIPEINLNEISRFLCKNYVFGYKYSKDYLSKILKNPTGIVIKYNNNIIGCIIGSKYKIQHYNKIINCYYIDYLCVDKKWRSRGICPLLIQSIINKFYPQENLGFIFKIEENPLSFLPLGDNKYYILENNNTIKINNNEIKELGKFQIPCNNELNDLSLIISNDYIKIIKYNNIVLYFTIETFEKNKLATIYGIFSKEKILDKYIQTMFSYLKQKFNIAKCVFLDTKYNKPLFNQSVYTIYPSYDCRFYYYNIQFPKTYYGFENSINPI